MIANVNRKSFFPKNFAKYFNRLLNLLQLDVNRYFFIP